MRLRPVESPDRTRREPTGARLGLFGPFYLALWLNASALAAMVYGGRRPETCLVPPLLQMLAWTVSLGGLAALACLARILLHDLLVSLSLRDRFLLSLFTLLPLGLPALVRGPRIVPEGFLWATPLMILFAVTPSLSRRLLALTLVGAFLAAGRVDGEPGLWLALGFGASWLLALGATHFAFTGEPHGLGGGWPVNKVVMNTVAAALPAGIAAGLLWIGWPRLPPTAISPGGNPPQSAGRVLSRLDPFEQEELIFWVIVMLVLTMLTILIMHFFRKWLLRRSAHAMATTLIPGQVAQVEMRPEPPPTRKMKLTGMRGQIVRLWGRWAAALEQAGEGRAPGETAAAYASRLHAEREELRPPPSMTALLERAHYGQEEPGEAEVELMERYVQEAAAKLKQAGEKPKTS